MKWSILLTSLLHCWPGVRYPTRTNRLAERAMTCASPMPRWRAGMPQTALAVTRDILQSDPRNVGALLRQGDALLAMGQPDAAEECYRRAVAVDPRSVDGLRGLGRSLLAWARRARPKRCSAGPAKQRRTMPPR